MFQNEAAVLDTVSALKPGSDLRVEVTRAVEEILAMRRASLFGTVTNPLQKEALVERGAVRLREHLVALGVDPDQSTEDGANLPESLATDVVSTILAALMAQLMTQTYPID